jgi:hypothetical protein
MSCDDIAKWPPSNGHHIGNIKELLWKNVIFKTKLVDTRKKVHLCVFYILHSNNAPTNWKTTKDNSMPNLARLIKKIRT